MLALAEGGVRYFTIREMARLQGFPDDFICEGSWRHVTRQLGNAVPAEVGEAFGVAMAELLLGKMLKVAAELVSRCCGDFHLDVFQARIYDFRMAPTAFRKGQLYSRAQIADRIRLPAERLKGGPWETGYSSWNDEFFIFCNVGVAGTNGHDYPNRWDGKDLLWTGKTRSRMGTPFVNEMLSGARPVHLFWRGEERTPFTYAGLATAAEVIDTIPVQVRWSFESTPELFKEVSPKGPIWRRGPPPTVGAQTTVREDGPTELYVMMLDGPVQAIFPGLVDGLTVVKLGMSNDPIRRLDELNFGFPPGSSIEWRLHRTRTYPSGQEAFAAEGEILEALRLARRWIGGEFAVVPREELGGLLGLPPS